MTTTSMMDENKYQIFASTTSGFVIPTITGTLSFFSSCLLMVTIYRSKQNTPYHRIMFFMSFWDTIASFGVALTTLPMPRNVLIDYKGPSYGNSQTCRAQAFAIFLGWSFVACTNGLLNIYYLCAIRYNVHDMTFRKYAEPVFLLLSIPMALAMPVYLLAHKAFNPTPYNPFCVVDTYPPNCLTDETIDCNHGSAKDWDEIKQFYYSFLFTGLGMNFIVLILSMAMVIFTVACSKPHANDTPMDGIPKEKKKAIAVQASMYVAACFLAWIFTIASFFVKEEEIDFTVYATFKYIFTPLQGFLNLLIFSFIKLYSCDHQDFKSNSSIFFKLKTMFRSPHLMIEKYLICNIDFLSNGNHAAQETPFSQPLEEPKREDQPTEEPADSKLELFADLEDHISFSQSGRGNVSNAGLQSNLSLSQQTYEPNDVLINKMGGEYNHYVLPTRIKRK